MSPASHASPRFCAIDFGTSNSAVAVPSADNMRLVPLEPQHTGNTNTSPTAVFYFAEGAHDADGPPRAFGRAAIQAYVDGHDGRLMRSMKSILGSSLIDQTTDVGGGRGAKYFDIVAGYLKRLRRAAGDPQQVVLGRPVFFVDGDAERDAQAQSQLAAMAQAVGFTEVQFQFEPIAAAFDFERQATREQVVLVADIGGGTSDFSVVRVGPERMARLARRDDILASHGVHIAGTDFDRHIELVAILREFGFRALGPSGREVPSGLYFDLATWHLINTCYAPLRVAEWRGMRKWFERPEHHARLMTVLDERLGHELAARAEDAKIAISGGSDAEILLDLIEPGLHLRLSEPIAIEALRHDLERIVTTAHETVLLAGLAPTQIDALYLTGGSTGLRPLADALAAAFPQAQRVTGDRFASVATGLGLYAERVFSPA
ncbi:Hsp70 family protein [Roseateles paludis]|uniref:Hsp70 family protein n=1 Tax=Roseateles paludis TaxID=3145238 RepID=A0ABV0FWA9_9BURK